MTHSAIARGHGDVFELDVHVVLGWKEEKRSVHGVYSRSWGGISGSSRLLTLDQFAAICLTGRYFERDNMALRRGVRNKISL